jgi:hypothetical protein
MTGALLACGLLVSTASANNAGLTHYPDLQTIIPTDTFSVVQGAAGKEFRYTHLVYNQGPGPLDIMPQYNQAAGGYARGAGGRGVELLGGDGGGEEGRGGDDDVDHRPHELGGAPEVLPPHRHHAEVQLGAKPGTLVPSGGLGAKPGTLRGLGAKPGTR